MKSTQETNSTSGNDSEPDVLVSGDTIGDTAYSERFVLKILLKFANLDTLKDDLKEKDFEDSLCTLWDMTAEKDVVEFLLKHDVLNLFQFSMPTIESVRINEIIIGIIGNMCCERQVVLDLLKSESFTTTLLEFIKTDDSLVLIQVLRVVNASLYLCEEDNIESFMDLFEKTSYSEALYFILENSSNKDLLINSLENLNSVCSYCNIEKCRTSFFKQFIRPNSVEAVSTALSEIVVNLKDSCKKDELERILVISLQIILNLTGFEKSTEILNNVTDAVSNMLELIMNYYELKISELKEIDSDLVDIIESSTTIADSLKLYESCEPEKFILTSYKIWKNLHGAAKVNKNGSNGFEDDDKDASSIAKEIVAPITNLICNFIHKCNEDSMHKALDYIGTHFDDLLSCLDDVELKEKVTIRTSKYVFKNINNHET